VSEQEKQEQNFRRVRAFEKRILENGFDGMELAITGREESSRLVYDCFASDGWNNYSKGAYIGSVIFDLEREGAIRKLADVPEDRRARRGGSGV
jgi:hypothetical protein